MTRALGGCAVKVADKTLHFFVHKTRNKTFLLAQKSLELIFISLKEERVNPLLDRHINNILGSLKELEILHENTKLILTKQLHLTNERTENSMSL